MKIKTKENQEIPIEDIEYFCMYHQSGYAGQKVLAVLKQGKYPFNSFDVQVKNNKKIRKLIWDYLFKEVIKNHDYEGIKLYPERLKEIAQ